VTSQLETGDEATQEARLEELRRAATDGDEGAMSALLATLSPLVHRRCAKFLPCPADAEEAAQDALLLIATRLASYSGRGSFLGWVTVVASNSARSTYRSLRSRWSEQPAFEPPEPVDPRTTSVIAGSRLDLLEALDALERRHPELVPPVVLRDLASLSYAEVAAQTGLPLGTVKARIHDGRKFLRQRLRDSS
jgi:RNA polymerase sigma factor (sigma-70 family)